ncbi:hypothetical protein AAI421_14555 [Rhodococcus aetherivorans]|uniref:hypothetical protein n=1 Tax=Rhodococcus aetherivorans TaxID=191292 RepID=UPI0031D23B2A
MTWFKVDDGFYDHPKVLGLDMSAIGLWTMAGAYCARHLTDGVITDRQIRSIGGTRKQAEKLVTAGLWSADDAPPSARRYAFNDWRDFQPSRDEVTAKREEARERMAAARAKKRTTSTNSEMFARTNEERSEEVRQSDLRERSHYPDPTRPDPTRPSIGYVEREGSVGERARENLPPSQHCPKHPGGTDAPCRACGDARRTYAEYEARQAAADKTARSAEARAQAELRAQAIAECNLCDHDGYSGTSLCDHDPDRAARARRGIAAIRATLTKPKDAA